ncbi:ribonuclease H-like domain-containing protein [Tanacetum coccineum]
MLFLCLADEVIHSFLATNADDVDLIHDDLDQIDDLDLEEMDINWQIAMTAIKIKKFYKKTGRRPRVDGKMHVAFDKRKVECFNCHNTGHFARECKFKGSKEGSRQEAGKGQNFKPVQIEKEALMTIDEGQINWVEQTTDEELNHALMAFTVNNEVSMCSKLCLDSFNALQAKYDELQSEFGDQEAALVAHKLAGTDEGYYDIPLTAIPHSPTVSNASSIVFSICPSNDSNEELGVVSDASSTHYSTCQSNDSDGELGTVTDHSVNDDSIPIPSSEQVSLTTQKTQSQVPTPPQTVDPSCAQHVKTPRQPIRTPVTPSPISSYNRQNWNQRMERELGAGYSFVRKPCFVCGSLSHLIKDCDYYEKKMAREAALKSKRFTPRPVQLSNIRPNFSTASRTIKTGRVNVNTGKQNVSSGSKHVNSGSVHFNSGTQFKSGSSRVNTGKQNVNTARVNRPVLSNQTSQDHPLKHMEHRGIFDSGCSGHMTGNRAHLKDYQELSKSGSVTFEDECKISSAKWVAESMYRTLIEGARTCLADHTYLPRFGQEAVYCLYTFIRESLIGKSDEGFLVGNRAIGGCLIRLILTTYELYTCLFAISSPEQVKGSIDIDVKTEEDADLMKRFGCSCFEALRDQYINNIQLLICSLLMDDESPEIRIYDKSCEGKSQKPLKMEVGLKLCKKNCCSLSFNKYVFLVDLPNGAKVIGLFCMALLMKRSMFNNLPGFVDLIIPTRVYKVVKALYGLLQAQELSASSMESKLPLLKGEDAFDVDVTCKLQRLSFNVQSLLKSSRANQTWVNGNSHQVVVIFWSKTHSWQCKKTTNLATSTTEDEDVAAAKLLWTSVDGVSRNQWRGTRGRNSPNTLEAQNSLKGCLFKNQGQIDKAKEVQEKKESSEQESSLKLDFQKDNTGAEDLILCKLVLCEIKEQREGKAPMLKEEVSKFILDALLAKGLQKKKELTGATEERKAQVQFEIDSFVPIKFEATKDSLKRLSDESFKQRLQMTEREVKDDEAKMMNNNEAYKGRKQIARKGMHTSMDENVSDDSDKVDEQEETNTGTETPLNPVPVAMKTPSEIVESENMDVTTVESNLNITSSNIKTVKSNLKSAGVKSNGDAVEPKTVSKNSFRPPVIEDWNSDDESEVEIIPNVKDKTVRPSTEKIKFVRETVEKVETSKQNKHYPRGNQRNWNNLMSQRLGSDFKMINKACFVCGSFEHLHYVCDKKVIRPVWNNSSRVNHKNFANKMTHPHPNRRFVPQAVLTRSGKINTAGANVNTAVRPVNTAGSKPTVNHPRSISNAYKRGYSQVTRPFNKYSEYKNSIFNKKVNTVRVKDTTARDRAVGNPQQKEYKEKGVIDSGCSRHMTGNKCYLTEYEDYDGGFVSFGDGKGRISGKGKIKTGTLDFDNVYFCKELKYNLFSVSQICDKKNNVLFTDTECLVLSSDFKLLDESQVLLRVPRKDNIYSVDLKSVVPTKGLTCLFAKATIDESNAMFGFLLGFHNSSLLLF